MTFMRWMIRWHRTNDFISAAHRRIETDPFASAIRSSEVTHELSVVGFCHNAHISRLRRWIYGVQRSRYIWSCHRSSTSQNWSHRIERPRKKQSCRSRRHFGEDFVHFSMGNWNTLVDFRSPQHPPSAYTRRVPFRTMWHYDIVYTNILYKVCSARMLLCFGEPPNEWIYSFIMYLCSTELKPYQFYLPHVSFLFLFLFFPDQAACK